MHKHSKRLTLLLVVVVGITACGQKGPLTLPSDPETNQIPTQETTPLPSQQEPS